MGVCSGLCCQSKILSRRACVCGKMETDILVTNDILWTVYGACLLPNPSRWIRVASKTTKFIVIFFGSHYIQMSFTYIMVHAGHDEIKNIYYALMQIIYMCTALIPYLMILVQMDNAKAMIRSFRAVVKERKFFDWKFLLFRLLLRAWIDFVECFVDRMETGNGGNISTCRSISSFRCQMAVVDDANLFPPHNDFGCGCIFPERSSTWTYRHRAMVQFALRRVSMLFVNAVEMANPRLTFQNTVQSILGHWIHRVLGSSIAVPIRLVGIAELLSVSLHRTVFFSRCTLYRFSSAFWKNGPAHRARWQSVTVRIEVDGARGYQITTEYHWVEYTFRVTHKHSQWTKSREFHLYNLIA